MVRKSSVAHGLDAVQLHILGDLLQHPVGILGDQSRVQQWVLPSLLAVGQRSHDGPGYESLGLLEAVHHVAPAYPACTAASEGLGDVVAGHINCGLLEGLKFTDILDGGIDAPK